MTLVIDVSCKGTARSRRFVLQEGQNLEVGRANEDLNLANDPRLSRRHFLIEYSDREITVTHLSRTNPTLVASEGTADFQEVDGMRIERLGCRIIAGSHRFVATVEAPESEISPTLDGQEFAEQWSDVDDAESDFQQPAVELPPEEDDEDLVEQQPVFEQKPTIVSRSKDKEDRHRKLAATKHDDLFDDLAGPAPDPYPAPKRKDNKPEPDPPSSLPNKLHFPIADDFFED